MSHSYNIEAAETKHAALEKMDCQEKGTLWGGKDVVYDLQLDNFDVNADAIVKTSSKPQRILRFWIKNWEKRTIKDKKNLNDRHQLIEINKDLRL